MNILLLKDLEDYQATSMDLYVDDLKDIFEKLEITTKTISPKEGLFSGALGKYYRKYFGYQKLVKSHDKKVCTKYLITDHSAGHLCTLFKGTYAVCHDIADYKFSELNPLQLHLWRKRVEGLKKAKKIFCISENTLTDVRDLLSIPEEKLVLNYYGRNLKFRRLADKKNLRSKWFPGLKDDDFLVLHVGSNIARKNMGVLVNAFYDDLKEYPNIHLVKVGHSLTKESDYGEKSSAIANLHELGFLTQDELVEVYNACDLFSFPSTYEGFGRPILEAQSCGIPSVLCDSSCLREVGGKAAIYHDADDSSELAAVILKIKNDFSFRNHLIESGLENVKKFSWDKHVQVILDTMNAK